MIQLCGALQDLRIEDSARPSLRGIQLFESFPVRKTKKADTQLGICFLV